jgi:hypothetical protein
MMLRHRSARRRRCRDAGVREADDTEMSECEKLTTPKSREVQEGYAEEREVRGLTLEWGRKALSTMRGSC